MAGAAHMIGHGIAGVIGVGMASGAEAGIHRADAIIVGMKAA